MNEKPARLPIASSACCCGSCRGTSAPNGQALTVVGIVEEGFRGANPLVRTSAFVPVTMLDAFTHTDIRETPTLDDRGQEGLTVLGRRAPGVTVEQARAALQNVTDRPGDRVPRNERGPIPAGRA